MRSKKTIISRKNAKDAKGETEQECIFFTGGSAKGRISLRLKRR
jgi:hypothetical protein